MHLAFSASQELSLPISEQTDRLSAYLDEEDRVVRAMLSARQLELLGPGRYRYVVTRVQVFQLQVQPIVDLAVHRTPERLELEALDCELDGLGLVDDFRLRLCSWLSATPEGLEGEASLGVTVSRPPLLKLIPKPALEATGRSVLNGILLGIKGRVRQQVVADFHRWCAAGRGS